MEFVSVIVVLLTYFIRPQDWVPGMSGFNIVQPLMAVALFSMIARTRGFSVRSLLQTPHDWAILAYGIYVVFTAPEWFATLKEIIVFLAFYLVTAQALVTPRRLEIFVRCWFFSILGIAAMALASEYGLDLTHAQALTHEFPDNPRLVLNTYLFDNPNALGHTVILLIPIAYFLYFWRRPVQNRIGAILTIAIAGYCVFLTRSKGAYISGFFLVSCALLLGRNRMFQAVILGLAATIGWGALTLLPRMEQLTSARQNEAIMGRMFAWEVARTASLEHPTGEGWKQFEAFFEWEGEVIPKATHSSYVKIGADLGVYGMFFFLGVLYCCLRSLLTGRYENESDERCRRVLVVLILGYMVSGWMIDRSYHLEYCLMAGAVAALHRRRGVEVEAIEAVDVSREALDMEIEIDERSYATIQTPDDVDTSDAAEEAIEEELVRKRFWKRLNLIDLAATAVLTWSVFWFWDYVRIQFFVPGGDY